MKRMELRKKSMLYLSIGFLLISIGLQVNESYQEENYFISYESVNIKNMAMANNPTKIEEVSPSLDTILLGAFSIPVDFDSVIDSIEPIKEVLEEIEFPPIFKDDVLEEIAEPKPVWYLPTEMGYVTQNPHYGHAALDITSPRGYNEIIYPIAEGVISGIYVDPAGALVVTVLHDIGGTRYTSQYAHLSSFADGLFIGMAVNASTPLGRMGTTGYSTGVHLHLAVVDCALFDPNDANCSDLNHFFRYANLRVSQGYLGLGSHIIVPGQWSGR